MHKFYYCILLIDCCFGRHNFNVNNRLKIENGESVGAVIDIQGAHGRLAYIAEIETPRCPWASCALWASYKSTFFNRQPCGRKADGESSPDGVEVVAAADAGVDTTG